MGNLSRLSAEDAAAGVKIIQSPLKELEVVDVSDRNVERMVRGFIVGSQAIGRRREVRAELEDRVVKRIGKKGKWLTDKLFELIEGVYVIDKAAGNGIRYYKVPPNLAAITYALDRVLGKPTQHTEHVEEKRGVMVIESIIRNLAEGKKNGNEGTTSGTIDADVVDVRVGEELVQG